MFVIHVASVRATRPFERKVVDAAPDVQSCVRVLMRVWSSTPGKIISIETSALRATGRPGWEDLVRKCIYAFFQPQGKEPSLAKKLLHEGESPPVTRGPGWVKTTQTNSGEASRR